MVWCDGLGGVMSLEKGLKGQEGFRRTAAMIF